MSAQLSLKDLTGMKAIDIPDDDRVKERFINVYNKIHGNAEGDLFYEKERFNLVKIISSDNKLKGCSGLSVYGTFLDIASYGLTLDNTSKPMLYVMSRNAKAGKDEKGKDQWESRMYVEISPYGELALRIQAGQIIYSDDPVVCYDGDLFQPFVDDNGIKRVRYQAQVPRKGTTIIGCFVKHTRPDHTFDYGWLLPEDITRLQGYSEKQNSKWENGQRVAGNANALYHAGVDGQIDSGFLKAKTLKHSFTTFPKLKLGQFSALEKEPEQIQSMDYGLSDTKINHSQVPEEEKTEQVQEQPKQSEAVKEEVKAPNGGFVATDNNGLF